MHTTIYYTINGESFKDAQQTLEHILNEGGTEDNWFTIIASIRREDLKLRTINKCGYSDDDLLIENIVKRVNEDELDDKPINEATLWNEGVSSGIWDVQSLTSKVVDFNKPIYLFIINMHT